MENNNPNETVPEELDSEKIHRIIKEKVHRIDHEFTHGFEFIKNYNKSVTFFGSARFTDNNPHYEQARNLARKISELGYTILTGGGGGIMEAANRGAFEIGNPSVGLNIRLQKRQGTNHYTTDAIEFDYFFARKVALSFAAEAYLFFPGGFGTLDEMFEILTLIQTRKIRKIPIILVGHDFWDDLQVFIKNVMLGRHKTINAEDMNLYTITDDDDEILEIIKKVPIKPMVRSTGDPAHY
ncbi:MAG: TIGR00730 family Rossman fold protein [Patescibacteria group bacterium]